MKKVLFILPINSSLPSIHVRAKCLEEYICDAKVSYIDLSKAANKSVIGLACYLKKELVSIDYKRGDCAVVIKPNSVLLAMALVYLMGIRIILDVNDPIHLPEHLGRWSFMKAFLLFRIASVVVFESPEYRSWWSRLISVRGETIEDTTQSIAPYYDIRHRDKQVIWYGSKETSLVLLDFIDHLKIFGRYGYKIAVLGAAELVIRSLRAARLTVSCEEYYDYDLLEKSLNRSMCAFVPMPDVDAYRLRGNLKAKIAMGYGCIAIVSNLEMHRRLIDDGVDGFIFEGEESIARCLDIISNPEDIERISRKAYDEVRERYNVKDHARKIVELCEETRG